MTAPTPSHINLAALARRCLDAVVAHHDEHGWHLPERRYLAAGEPNAIAADDEHLAVMLEGMQPGSSQQAQRGQVVQSRGARAQLLPRATLVVRLMRCIPVGDEYGAPDADVIDESGMELFTDVGRVLSSLYAWAGSENSGPMLNGQVSFGQVMSLGPSGGIAGWMFPVDVSPVQ